MIPKDTIKKGIEFIKNNPQLLYTLFLVIIIPLAFVFTSEKFLSIARKQNDLAEQNRAGLLHDSYGSLLSYNFNPEKLDLSISEVGSKNQTLTGFYIVAEYEEAGVQRFDVVSSLNKNEVSLGSYTPDDTTNILMRFAIANPEFPLTKEYYKNTERTWKTVSLVKNPTDEIKRAYIVSDISMSNTDANLSRDIRNAYFLLAAIILLIILLLARHAKIVDYAALYKRLSEVDRMKDDFVSIAAHELRTPLTIIRGKLEQLKDLEIISYNGKNIITDIDNSAKDLNSLVGDILDVSRLQEGRMSFHFSTINVADILGDVYRSSESIAKNKGLELKYEPVNLPGISADKTRFKQVLINLVGNAIKYTQEGSVSILPKVVEEGKFLEIRISDTGIGINSEAQKKLFSKFYRVKSDKTKDISGTGLGLWITAEMVRQMNGVISVESIEGKGSDFIIKFKII